MEMMGRGGPWCLSRCPGSQVGRLERLGPHDAWHSMDHLGSWKQLTLGRARALMETEVKGRVAENSRKRKGI